MRTEIETYNLIEQFLKNELSSDELISFIMDFYKTQNIPLDAIYTGKMLFGLFDMINKDYFRKGSSILAIHTGGLQGNRGMNERFRLNLPHNL